MRRAGADGALAGPAQGADAALEVAARGDGSRAAPPPRRRGSGSSRRRRRRRRSGSSRARGRSALITGTRSIATVRQRVSSQKAQRSARLPPPRVTRIVSTSGRAARSWIAAAIAGAARRSWTGAKAQTIVPAQPRRARPASRSRRAAPPSAVTTPIVFGSAGRASCFCSSKRPSARSCLRSASSRASRSPSPASRTCGGAEGEARRGLAAARVVVGAAGDHDFGAVAQAALGQAGLLEVVEPDRAAGRAPSASRSSK